ncbi:MAG: GNAT family N-acetyltransferase [Marinicaulis sp.]|nr:GNAT family N-acetyltransferase [Marinicaulis sp.]
MTLIRALKREDEASWRRLWAGYLAFYKTDLPHGLTDALFERLLTGQPHFAFVAIKDDEMIGFVHCLPHASTWSIDDYCYLEDLYVDPSVRGSGAGRALIEAVYKEADRRGLPRVYWHTDNGNVTARHLYDKLATLSEFVQYRRS